MILPKVDEGVGFEPLFQLNWPPDVQQHMIGSVEHLRAEFQSSSFR